MQVPFGSGGVFDGSNLGGDVLWSSGGTRLCGLEQTGKPGSSCFFWFVIKVLTQIGIS